jgi:hypothetical protein
MRSNHGVTEGPSKSKFGQVHKSFEEGKEVRSIKSTRGEIEESPLERRR